MVSTTTSAAAGQGRDAERSRAAILDAAEAVFAERGYDAATMHEIGAAAGLSRGAPGYFFASKQALYDAVVARALAERDERLAPAFDLARALEPRDGGRAGVTAALDRAVGAYIDFLRERPAFVRLMQWEALRGGEGLRRAPRRSRAIEDGLRALAARLRRSPAGAGGRAAEGEAAQLVLSFVALCFFPLEHADTMLARMGLDGRDPAFAAARRKHVVDLLAGALVPEAGR